MRWLLVGYMFLFIDRPFEVWPWLGELHVERAYMLLTLAAWAAYPGKRFLPNLQHAAYAGFAAAVLLAWGMSPWAAQGEHVVEDWLKVVVFYVILVTTIHDERGLKHVAVGFLAVMALYLMHSFREYLGGRHTHRMGISRMVGVDTTLGDPNSFGASIVLALPVVVAVWRAGVGGRLGRLLLLGYVGLSCLCILLTGSRGSLLTLLVWFLILIAGTRHRLKYLAAFVVAAPLAYLALPESLQNRFETIVNPEAGPKSAQESGEGRIQGFFMGMDLWAANPLTGIGPGAWRPATGAKAESHSLYGQLAGELGTAGVVAFLGMLAAFVVNVRAVGRARRGEWPEQQNDLVYGLGRAVGVTVFLLLFLGAMGHNLFRFTWLWYGGFLVIARYCVARRIADWDYADEPEAVDEDWAVDAEPVPAGWVVHPPHAHR
ncbi:MAG: O-antigen ligase family protein [Gemmataceae bacterium]|nr:O-antigen ligase family protein [Gemmataceae bacterium]